MVIAPATELPTSPHRLCAAASVGTAMQSWDAWRWVRCPRASVGIGGDECVETNICLGGTGAYDTTT
jgi:hypothetical protein